MSSFSAMQASGSALTAGRLQMDLIAENLANLNTTRSAEGGAYRRKVTSFSEALRGVSVAEIQRDPSPLKRKFEPGHPDAGPDGWVDLPNVEVGQEIVELIAASRTYDANVTAFNAAKAMALRALDIGR